MDAEVESFVIHGYPIQCVSGLHTFSFPADKTASEPEWYCFAVSVAHHLQLSSSAVAMCLERQYPQLKDRLLHVRLPDHGKLPAVEHKPAPEPPVATMEEFQRLKQTYLEVKTALHGPIEAFHARKSDKLNLYPLIVVAQLLLHYTPARSAPAVLDAVRDFLLSKGSHDFVGETNGSDSKAVSKDGQEPETGLGLGLERMVSAAGSGRVVDASESWLQRLLGQLPVRDSASISSLQRRRTQRNERADELKEANVPHYALTMAEASEQLKQDCRAFTQYRQQVWNWNREPSQSSARTVADNLQVLLRFGGFVCKHSMLHRVQVKVAEFGFNVFGSKHIEQYVLDFLQFMRIDRQAHFSTISSYINSLIALAKFYFAERLGGESVLGGLARLRRQTKTQVKAEAVQRPIHPQWISWSECQAVRARCLEGLGEDDDADAERRQLDHALQMAVCLVIYTIAPPPRCSIVRLLQWRTTLVKQAAGAPTEHRYVIDLKNNADAPAAQHKSVRFHRRAVLPLPKMLTPILDRLQRLRRPAKGQYVFLNAHAKPYSTGAWTGFVKKAFAKFGSQGNPKRPGPSLLRSVFVSWLNALPHDTTQDKVFLENMKTFAAQYQTHSLHIANSLYDKDTASEMRLRSLVDFCEAYALRCATVLVRDDLVSEAKEETSLAMDLEPLALDADDGQTSDTHAEPPSLATTDYEEHAPLAEPGSSLIALSTPTARANHETLVVSLEQDHRVEPTRKILSRKRAREADAELDELSNAQSATVKRQLKKLGIAMNLVSVRGRL